MSRKVFIKISAFAVAFTIFFLSVTKIFTVLGADYRPYQWIRGFYEEPKNALDVVLIGSSQIYTSWMPPIAWGKYGIATWTYASMDQPLIFAESILKEARNRQPDALYIINIGTTLSSIRNDPKVSASALHFLTEYMPLSKGKLDLLKTSFRYLRISGSAKMEYYLPIMRFHYRWNELEERDFTYQLDGLKGASCYSTFLANTVDSEGIFRSTSKILEPSDVEKTALESLLNYCDDENIDVIFYKSPLAVTDENVLAEYNYIENYVENRGYPMVDVGKSAEEIGLDPIRDYYDSRHTNIHGALKVMDYLAEYLLEHYSFSDHRGDPAYGSWDEAYDNYMDVIGPYVLDFEYGGAERDDSLTAPALSRLSVKGTSLTLRWEAVKGADGYCVYRKTAESGWKPVADVGDGVRTYLDTDCKAGETYTYTVAPFRMQAGERRWGAYDIKGLLAQACLEAPEDLALSGSENELTVSWREVKGADGYQIYRRVPGKSWIKIGEKKTTLRYTDTAMLENVPYQYCVRAYWLDEDGEKVFGSYSKASLWLPELTGPEVTASAVEDVPTLTWPAIEGITNYTVTRRTAEGEWKQIAEPLAANSTQFRDVTATAGVRYEYQVTANIIHSKETYSYPSEPVPVVAEAELPAPDIPEILFCEQVGDAVRLVWKPPDNATAYSIYRRTAGESEWVTVKKSEDGDTYQDEPPETGTYTYVLQPLRTEGGCTYYGAFDENTGRTVTYRSEE